MKKKVLIVAICILLTMSLAACGSGAKADEKSSPPTSSSTSSSSGSDNEIETQKEMPYFDEKTRILTAGIPDKFGTIEMYVPEVCTTVDAELFCAMLGTGLYLNDVFSVDAKLSIVVSVHGYDTIENALSATSDAPESGHYVKYGDNEYYTDEGASDEDAYYIVKIGEYTMIFAVSASPEYIADAQKMLSSVKFNIKS